jgi:hypothetical protein
MSLPYHIGNGWFGGLLPTTAFAMVARPATSTTASGTRSSWRRITLVIGTLFIRETKDVDIYAND